MFDVIWTDHNRELVGERRARKELDNRPKTKDEARSNRSSISTASSSSRNEKPLGFLGAIGRNKTGQNSKSRSLTTAHSNDGTTGTPAPSYTPLALAPTSMWADEKQSINEIVGRRSDADYTRDSYDTTTDRSSQGGM